MFKNTIKIISVLFLAGFSFYYTEKVTRLIKEKDPIMIKINEVKDSNYIKTINPIINGDEYTTGIKGCTIDIKKSYDKMKTFGEYKEELLVMKEIENNNDLKDKYIIGGNKLEKKVSIIFYIKKDIDDNLIKYIIDKNIKINFFVENEVLENNTIMIKFLSDNNNIYYLGKEGKYDNNYLIYINNLIEIYTKNKSNYCLVEDKDDNTLKLCSKYNMKTIKVNTIKDNILYNIKNNLSNGSIISIDSNDLEKIKASINYILSKGYNIVTLDELLNESNNCNK